MSKIFGEFIEHFTLEVNALELRFSQDNKNHQIKFGLDF